MKPRKLPQRTCSGCKEQKQKKEMVRVVRSPEAEISLDLTGKKPGRGAYLCPNTACLAAAKKAKRLERAFSCMIPPEIYVALEEELREK